MEPKFHLHYLQLRDLGIALDTLLDKEPPSDDNPKVVGGQALITKITTKYLEKRFNIFKTYNQPKIDQLYFGQICLLKEPDSKISLVVITNQVKKDVYKVYHLNSRLSFSYGCPHDLLLFEHFDHSEVSIGTKAYGIVFHSSRNNYEIISGTITLISDDGIFSIQTDTSLIPIEKRFIALTESPFPFDQQNEDEKNNVCNEKEVKANRKSKKANRFKGKRKHEMQNVNQEAEEANENTEQTSPTDNISDQNENNLQQQQQQQNEFFNIPQVSILQNEQTQNETDFEETSLNQSSFFKWETQNKENITNENNQIKYMTQKIQTISSEEEENIKSSPVKYMSQKVQVDPNEEIVQKLTTKNNNDSGMMKGSQTLSIMKGNENKDEELSVESKENKNDSLANKQMQQMPNTLSMTKEKELINEYLSTIMKSILKEKGNNQSTDDNLSPDN
ncbi:hypothetical protein GPJ56_006976 [Histomonas meleagridis]|uniref:uncharacterized protein n=1 Tax=Histomonas meleagridis TaxID=135588 RepID=UPI00355A78DC|nr:hypothetical protein GPJ56_006976 [Histomonas meleagridis]KAH0797764.1 hypothetical protein GO595_009393 [Histomonas meleagridis]